jgi:hypothetical protein
MKQTLIFAHPLKSLSIRREYDSMRNFSVYNISDNLLVVLE